MWPRAAVALLAALALAGPAAAAPSHAVTNPSARAATALVADLVGGLGRQAAAIRTALAAPPAPAAGPSLSDREVRDIAQSSRALHEWIDGRRIARTALSFDRTTRLHTFYAVSKDRSGKETVEAQVFVNDDTGQITEVRTGPQVSWMMARGYRGAFGRAITRPAIWIPLCLVFALALVPLARPRRLLSWRTLDLLALLSFSLSLIWFNEGDVFTSVPLQYPPLAYLALRLAWIAAARARAARPPDPPPPEAEEAPSPPVRRRPSFGGSTPTWALITLLAVAMVLRLGLNAFDSNVIDVGYAGVIGADRIAHGSTPYGTMPSDCGSCDTYGPLNYVAYVPFELAQPWHGRWDDLGAAHAAATLFDLLCVAGMFALGWRIAGVRLGVALALAWTAFPFTAYALETNSNDSLVAAMLIWGLVLARHPAGRGAMLGLAMSAKFAPAVLLPLWSRRPFPRPGNRRNLVPFLAGLLGGVALSAWVVLLDGASGLRAFWSRTIGYQLGRDSPFSVWGQHPGLRPLQIAIMAAVGIAAVAVLRWPRRLDLLTVTALSGALMIGLQLTLTHWFYLYIPWFMPFALLAMVPVWPAPERAPAPEPDAAPAAPVAEPVAVA